MTAIIMSFEKRLLTISKILAPYISMFLSFSSYGITLVKGPNLPSMIMLVAGIFLANFGGNKGKLQDYPILSGYILAVITVITIFLVFLLTLTKTGG